MLAAPMARLGTGIFPSRRFDAVCKEKVSRLQNSLS